MSTLMQNGNHIICNGSSLQQSHIDNNNIIWTAMEIYCILDLTIHSDVRKLYCLNPNLNAALFEAQDWEQISLWMNGYFGKSHYCWFENGVKPKTDKYSAQTIKKCAIRILKEQNNGTLPVNFNEMIKICEKAKKNYFDKAVKILEQNKKMLELKLRQRQIANASSIKCEGNQCKKHLMGMLEKLSKYNVDTICTMRNKLDTKYKKLFGDLCTKYMDKNALKNEESKLQQKKNEDWRGYKEQIATKMKASWEENVEKLQQKYPQKSIKKYSIEVTKEYMQKYPKDEGIRGLFDSMKNSSKVSIVSNSKVM